MKCANVLKRLVGLVLLLVLTLVTGIVFAADPTVTVTPAPTFMSWVIANENALLKVALAITELMALVPFFKGNGIIDSIIKALKFLAEKEGGPKPGF